MSNLAAMKHAYHVRQTAGNERPTPADRKHDLTYVEALEAEVERLQGELRLVTSPRESVGAVIAELRARIPDPDDLRACIRMVGYAITETDFDGDGNPEAVALRDRLRATLPTTKEATDA